MRKARASHVQCECGAKPHAGSKEECFDNKSDPGDFHSDAGSDAPESKTCCCSHGMRCTCALKKEYLEAVPEIVDIPVVPPRRSASSSKPRLLKAGSENSLTVFTNGHHKPVHKHNDSAHKCGLPYKIPIPHSVPGSEYARRSTDSLPLIRKKEETHSQLHESISSAQQEVRLVRSEHGSPEPRPRSYTNGQVPPLDLPYRAYNETIGQFSDLGDYSQSPGGFDNYYTAEEQPPVLSAGLSMPPVDWSALDLDNGAFSAAYSQPPSYASFDHSNVGQSGLTTSSSGEFSDVGDYMSHNVQPSPMRHELPSSSAEELSYDRLSSSSFTSLPQTSMLSSSNLNSLDYETFLNASASPNEFEDSSAGVPLSSESFAKHGFTVHDAQKLAHPDTPTEAMGGLSLPAPEEEHIWAKRFSPEAGPCIKPDEVENNHWAQ